MIDHSLQRLGLEEHSLEEHSLQRQTRACNQTRRLVAGSTFMLTFAGVAAYVCVVIGNGSVNFFEAISIPLFTLLFGWISFSFSIATLGFAFRLEKRNGPSELSICNDSTHSLLHSSPTDTNAHVKSRTAILMPIYNESPESVFAGVRAMIQSLQDSTGSHEFDFYILSDTTKHDIWLAEEQAWDDLLRDKTKGINVYYRHRSENTARKAGNIADFVTRWGSDYRYMIILDADSLVAAETMIEMVKRMNADPELGILQVPPNPIGRNSLFARLQQFSACVYGPVFVSGFAQWAGNEGNYWGHNAIIRVDAFRKHCALPVLSGKAPLGGEILSHDFVEAALMLRAGWKVKLATDLGGSYEECPTTIADYAQRDQRWCQGNLQHAKLLVADNFRLFSRMHFGSGIMAYAASPIWVVFTLLCIIGMLWDSHSDLSTWLPTSTSLAPVSLAPVSLFLFATSMLLLLLPKVWAGILFTIEPIQGTDRCRLWVSVLGEIVASVLLSPIMAVYHTRFVLAAIAGKSIQWSAQQRSEHGVTWREAIHQFGGLTAGASIMTVLMWIFLPELLVWFSPLLIGALFSIPASVVMGSRNVGLRAKRMGLWIIPEESSPSRLCMHHQEALRNSFHRSDSNNDAESGGKDLFYDVIHRPKSFVLHNRIQRASHSDVPLPISQSKAIEAAFADGGAGRIPLDARTALLNDLSTLKALHLQAQIGS